MKKGEKSKLAVIETIKLQKGCKQQLNIQKKLLKNPHLYSSTWLIHIFGIDAIIPETKIEKLYIISKFKLIIEFDLLTWMRDWGNLLMNIE